MYLQGGTGEREDPASTEVPLPRCRRRSWRAAACSAILAGTSRIAGTFLGRFFLWSRATITKNACALVAVAICNKSRPRRHAHLNGQCDGSLTLCHCGLHPCKVPLPLCTKSHNIRCTSTVPCAPHMYSNHRPGYWHIAHWRLSEIESKQNCVHSCPSTQIRRKHTTRNTNIVYWRKKAGSSMFVVGILLGFEAETRSERTTHYRDIACMHAFWVVSGPPS